MLPNYPALFTAGWLDGYASLKPLCHLADQGRQSPTARELQTSMTAVNLASSVSATVSEGSDYRLNEPPAKDGIWNGLPQLAHSHAVFGYKDFCGSTVLGTPESVGVNGQIDWQAQQISHLVCGLAGQRCSEA